MKNKEIHQFALDWLDKFTNENTSSNELIDSSFADACFSFDFDMDCGESFVKVYGRALKDADKFEKMKDEITDIGILGSGIFSNWRYFNHWAYSSEEIKDQRTIKWFCVALKRLAELTE